MLNWQSIWGRDGVLRTRRTEGQKQEAEMRRTLAPRLPDLGLRCGSVFLMHYLQLAAVGMKELCGPWGCPWRMQL